MGEDPKPETFGEKFLRLLTPLWRAWLWLRERAMALKPCRVSILLVLGGLTFLLLAAQGEDVARALAERRSDAPDSWQAFWFFAASLAWSLSAWYWARVMLFLKFPEVPPLNPDLNGLRTWAPRLLGFLATLGVAAAFYKASQGYEPDEHQDVRTLLQHYAFWCAMGAVAFLVAVSVRRKVARAAARKLNLHALHVHELEDQVHGTLYFKDLGLLTRALLIGTILAAGALFAILVFGVQTAAPALGSAALVLLAAAGWIAAGSTLDFIGMRLRIPVFSGLLVLAVVFSLWNDNHEVRTLAEPQPAKRHTVRTHLRAWLDAHDAAIRRGERVPFYVVNAEGGGIRAAYWTVTVLGEIHNRHPDFSEYLFSMSGVSGGSLGVSVFAALIAEQRRASGEPFDLKQKAQAILSEDFLSPVVASMLFPDLAQRFLPFPVPAFDRAVTLEQSWEKAWQTNVGGRNRMAEPFDRLWQDQPRWMPTLLLNATWVETGKRIITSNIRVAAGKRREDFVDVEDANAFFAPRSIPLSTAAHMSARFTYVSPAGTLVKDGRTHGRVVDGGYFENSGATATLAILQIVNELARKDKRWEKVDPYVIHISNDPVEAKFANDSLRTAPDNPYIKPRQLLNEALSPLLSLLHTRDARGYYARESVAWQVGHQNYLHFGLCRRSANIPLGWVLSRSTRDRMEDQLTNLKCVDGSAEPVFDNPENLKKIDARMASVPSTPNPPDLPASLDKSQAGT